MSIPGARAEITKTVESWEGVSAYPHRFGGTEFRLGKRELGHIHGDWLVDIPFPKKVRDEIVASGKAEPHHVLPESGWISFYLRDEADVQAAIALLRQSFEIAVQQKNKRLSKSSGSAGLHAD